MSNLIVSSKKKRFKPREEVSLKTAVDLWCSNKEKAMINKI